MFDTTPTLDCNGRPLRLDRTRVMGIVNVTPDSFSDGGEHATTEAAIAHGVRMAEEGADKVGGVMHCFTESWEVAQRAIEMNFYISFSGIVTFKNAVALKDVARRINLGKALIETDSPYLAPVPYRGKTNQPAFVRYVAEEMATLRGIAVDEVAEATSANFFNLFKAA